MPKETRIHNGVVVPFDAAHLDALMEVAGIDVLLATSKHSIQYLLGGYRYMFFQHMDAIGQSRYLPILIYPRGRPDQAAYFGNAMECFEHEFAPHWTPEVQTLFWGTLDTMTAATAYLRQIGAATAMIGIESSFLPTDAYRALQTELPHAAFAEALKPMEKLRAVKTPSELASLREASERVVDAMLAVFSGHGPGTPKRDLVAALRREEHARGLSFDYCLATVGPSLNRAPITAQPWEAGQPLSLDSGASYEGYIGDLCRMAVLGEPGAELEDLLGEVREIQDAALALVQSGVVGGEVCRAGEEVLQRSRHRNHLHFVVHGIGLVSHEVPHLTDKGPVPYPAEDALCPLKTGMVLSVETTMLHQSRGFIKLEDTVEVLDRAFAFFGGGGRFWNPGRT